ncbi:carbohydrate-binding protein [Paenibacillus lutimineralis]|uniref:CBM3 domain-containing protein n=1 Tax=Paenibacillus lutimineralis TaxID=2707005 RepID=A0A3Q9IAG4_9BACL|nr:carbohydrate-binding protein [Paenibacillus lutimineralis]AZS13822.1 hypothetical protein EI981_04720 [Paenibacillus lutimineralis]
MKKFNQWRRICAIVLSLLLVVQMLPWQPAALAATNGDERRFIRVEPSVFQPSQGETTLIRWNWEVDHPTVIKLVSGEQTVTVIQGEKNYAGGYVPHEFVWNGQDEQGNIVAAGTYNIVVEPQDLFKPYASVHPVTILGGEAKDIAISPNLQGDRFTVYGKLGKAQGVTGVTLTLTSNGDTSRQVEATVEEGRWFATVGLTPYTETSIEAEIRGSGAGKPSLTVTNHPFRFFDELSLLGLQYYGDARHKDDILADNELLASSEEAKFVGQNILMINQTQRVRIVNQDPVLGGNMGIADLFAGINTNTPAHMGMGNNVGVASDLYIGGSFPLFFTRTYNSRDVYFSELGSYWSHTYSERLRDLDKAVLIRFEDGHIERYDKQSGGSYRAGEGIYNQLTKQGDGSFELKMQNQSKMYFSKQGLPTRYLTVNGVEMRLHFTGNQLDHVEREGGKLQFQYDEAGWLIKVSDHTGRSFSYTNEAGKVVSVTDVEGNRYDYQYNDAARLTQVNDANGTALRKMQYDDKGRLTDVRFVDDSGRTYQYDEAKRVVTMKEGSGLETRYFYDADLRLTKIVDAAGEQTFRYDQVLNNAVYAGDVGDQADKANSEDRVDTKDSNNSKAIQGDITKTQWIQIPNGKSVAAASALVLTIAPEQQSGSDASEAHQASQDKKDSLTLSDDTSPVEVVESDDKGSAESNAGNTSEDAASDSKTAPCSVAWDKQKVYVGGELVSYEGHTWRAKWWSLGEVPGTTGEWGAWEDKGTCDGIDPAPTPKPCNAVAWDKQQAYVGGEIVNYDGRTWKAKWWTQGDEPGKAGGAGVWEEQSGCDNNSDPGEKPNPELDEVIMAPDNGTKIIRAEMFNDNRSDIYNTLYPWYRLHNESDRPIALSDIRIRYFFTADSKDRLIFWNDWASIGSTHIDGEQRFKGEFISLKAPGVSVDTVLEMSFEADSGILQPGEYVELHTRISKERWTDFTQTNDFSFNSVDPDFKNWERIAVFVRGDWVWGSMPIAAALEVDPPTIDHELTIPDYYSKKTFVESGDARGAKTHYVYDDRGNLLEQTDALGNTTKFTYNEQNRITSVTDALGHTSMYTYDDKGNLLTATDSEGNITKYVYDGKGLPNEIILADGNKVKVEYDGNGNAIQVIDGLGAIHKQSYDELNRLIERIDPQGNKYSYEYTPSGLIKQVIDALGQKQQTSYNSFGEITELIDAAVGKTMYRYNEQGLLSELIDPLGNLTQYSYDDSGLLQQLIAPDGGITSYTYDLWNRVTAFTDAEGNVTRYEYDAIGNLIRETDARGHVTTNSYDLLNRLTKTVQVDGAVDTWNYDAVGQLIEYVDAAGGTSRYTYNGSGQLLSETDAAGHITKYAYTPTGQRLSMTDATGNVTKYEYDGNGNLSTVIDALGNKTSYTYDSSGRLNEGRNALGQTTTYSYDPLGQLLSRTDAGGSKISYTYTPLGQVASMSDALGHQTEYNYDAVGQLTEVQDALGHKTRYSYDAVGNLTSQTRIGTNGEEQVTKYGYDKLQRRIEVMSPLGQQTRYSYDPSGNLIETVDPAGKKISQTYDANNRLMEIAYSAEKQAKFAYNQRGELVRMEDWNGVTDIQRDVLGQITRVTDPKQRTVNYTWTPVGNKASLTTPDGKQTTYDYDALNRLSNVKDHTGTTAYTYNAAGQLIEKTVANGSTTQYSYNSRGLLEKLSEQNQAGNILNKHEYSYDAAGNILNWIETIDGKKRDKSYTYDELNQLIQVIDQGQERTYRYDSFGNRIEKAGTGDPTTYSYNSANQLLEEKSGGVQKKYQYDPRGNLITVTTGSKTLENYTFDETNRLIQAVKDGKTAEYRYNARGVRIQSQTADKTQDFVTDLTSAYNDLLAVYEGETLQASYTYGLNRLQVHLPNGQSETYSYDHLGSIVGLQDQQGKMIETHRYDEFGLLQTQTQTDRAVGFTYTGYPYEDNGLYYAQARYYKPEVGRFISEYAYEGQISNPQSLNRYMYVLNNPLKYIDPRGYDAIIITNPNLAFKQGHTSAIIQDKDGKWYYFYWGDQNVHLVEVDSVDALNSLEDFNFWASNKKIKDKKGNLIGLAGFGDGGYKSSTYIKGDFNESVVKANKIYKAHSDNAVNKDYNVATKNCLQVTESVLDEGMLANGTKASRFFATNFNVYNNTIDHSRIIPNIAKARFQVIFYNNAFTYEEYQEQLQEVKESYNSMNWVMKKVSKAKYHLFRINILLDDI